MEISLQGVNSLKLRGKHATLSVNPADKTANYSAALILGNPAKNSLKIREDVVIIDGPGEYEVSGIKITGMRDRLQTVYSISMDGLELILGERETLEKMHQKLKEYNVGLFYIPTPGDASFATALSANAMVFFGESAKEIVNNLAGEEKKETAKYQITAEKSPSETETVLLSG